MDAKRIVIIASELAMSRMLSRLFLQRGWSTSEVDSTDEVLRALDPPPDWVFLDLRLRDGNGWNVVPGLRSRASTTRLAIVNGLGGQMHEMTAGLRPDLVVGKPIDVLALLDVMKAIEAGRSGRRPMRVDAVPSAADFGNVNQEPGGSRRDSDYH
jgi:DNA-binding response OmpR family regulator